MARAEDVRRCLALLQERPARLGTTRLLCVDGPAGSGKTTFARDVAEAAGDAHVLHLDLLLDGWEGLPRVASTLVRDVLEPLRAGREAAYLRYDWHAGRFAARVPVPRCGLLVVEGVGAGSRATAPHRTVSVWLEAAREVRHARAMARDGEVFAPHWDAWAAAERRLFAVERTRTTADLVVHTDR